VVWLLLALDAIVDLFVSDPERDDYITRGCRDLRLRLVSITDGKRQIELKGPCWPSPKRIIDEFLDEFREDEGPASQDD